MRKINILVILLHFAVACTPVKYKDISNDNDFINIKNKLFVLNQDLLAIGVTFDENYKKQIDYTYLMKPPGIAGPQVVNTSLVKKGVIIKIDKLYLDSASLNKQIIYGVSIYDKNYDLKNVVVKLSSSIKGINYGLDKEVFQLVTF